MSRCADEVADSHLDRERAAPNQKRWHYPANFEGTIPDGDDASPWNLLEQVFRSDNVQGRPSSRASVDSITGASAYPTNGGGNGGGGGGGYDDDVPEWGKDYGSQSKPKKNKFGRKKSKQTVGDRADYGAGIENAGRGYADDVARDDGWSGANGSAGRSGGGGGAYGGGSSGGGAERRNNGPVQPAKPSRNGDPNWEHEF